MTLWGNFYYYSTFTNKEIKIKEQKAVCPVKVGAGSSAEGTCMVKEAALLTNLLQIYLLLSTPPNYLLTLNSFLI